MQAGYPAFCEHDTSLPQSLKIPTLPEEFHSMSENEQIETMMYFRLEEANLYYTAATGIHNERHMNALRIPHLGMRQYLTSADSIPLGCGYDQSPSSSSRHYKCQYLE